MTTSTPSELVGRERLLEKLHTLLSTTDGCVITLRGPGGVGKTTLGRALVQPTSGAFVELDVCQTVDDVVSAIGEALLLSDRSVTAIAETLAITQMPVLVLDNAEHVLDAVKQTLTALREHCEGARIVVTSRERLGVEGEDIIDVAPLEGDDAVRLFEIRAHEACADFVLDDSNRDDIRALIDLVDGLPLAIELAASRVRILEPRAIVERLDARFEILRDRSATTDRHATLDACVGWSFELLSESERSVLNQLAIFRGRFRIEEAEGVAICDEWVGDILESLIEKSLLRVERNDRVEFVPYEGVRRYVEQHTPFSDELILRYAGFYTRRMAAPNISHAELQNVVHAYELVAEVDFPVATKLLMEARHRLVRGGFLARLFEMIDAALAREDLDRPSEAWLHTALASCHYAVMDYTAVQRDLDRADAIAEELDLPVVRARVLLMRAIRVNEQDRAEEAEQFLAKARASLDGLPHDLRAHILGASGLAALKRNAFEESTQFLDAGVAAAHRTNDCGLLARTLSWSSLGYFAIGYRARGIARLEEALALFDSTHDAVSLTQAQLTLSHALSDHDPDRALEFARAAARSAAGSRLRIQAAQCEAMLARLEGGPGAVARLRRALGVFSADSVRNDRWATWLALCLQMLSNGDTELAIQEFRNLAHAVEVVDDRDELRHIHRFLAVVYALNEDWDAASEVLADDAEFLDAMRCGGDAEAFDEPYRRMMHDFQPMPFEIWEKLRPDDVSRVRVEVRGKASELALPNGDIVELESRYVLRRLFLAMLAARRERPGQAMSLEDLVGAGWPDESMTYESGIRRVYSAIRNIRRLGLEEIVLTAENGYLLSTEIEFVDA